VCSRRYGGAVDHAGAAQDDHVGTVRFYRFKAFGEDAR
jgi:hypothetical protein